MRGKRDERGERNKIFKIIWLQSLYYFIRSYVKIRIWDIEYIVK